MKMNFERLGQCGIFRSIFTEKDTIAIVFKILAWERRRNTLLYWLRRGFNKNKKKGDVYMERFEINLDEINELEDIELPAGGSGFGCTCSGAAVEKQ